MLIEAIKKLNDLNQGRPERAVLDIFRTIFGYIRDRFIGFYVMTTCIIHFRWISILIIPLGFIFNQLLLECFMNIPIIVKQIKLIFGYIVTYDISSTGVLTAKEYLVSDYLKWQYEYIDESFIKFYHNDLLGYKSASLNTKVCVYHIQDDNLLSANLTCYAMSPFKSYIFFNHPPEEDMGAFQQFSFLHELGHACTLLSDVNIFTTHCVKLYFVFFIFIYFLVNWHGYEILILSFFLSNVLFILYEKKNMNRKYKLMAEILADTFSLSYLDENNKDDLYNLLKDGYVNLFFDAEIKNEDNNARLKLIEQNITMTRNRNESEVIRESFSDKYMYKPILLLLAISCAINLAAAFYSKNPSPKIFVYLLISTVFALVIFLCLHFIIHFLERLIDSKLAEWKRNQ